MKNLRVELGARAAEVARVAVIDAHVHLYPPDANRDPAAWAVEHKEPHWAVMCARVRKTTGRPVQGFPSVDELLRSMDSAGVDRAVLLGWYWENHYTCVTQNRFYAECVKAHPGRLSAFATVHAEAGEFALDEVRRAKDAGLIGLGELSPHSQHIAVDDPRWQAVLGLAGELDLPVNLHVTDPNSGKYPGRVETPWVDFRAMAKDHPNVRFILAHWGGCLWRDGQGELPENVWVDTAATPLLYGTPIWAEGVKACGADKVLWGTDYPLDLYPKDSESGRRRETFAGLLAEARERVGVGDGVEGGGEDGVRNAAVAEVLGGNAARLLRVRGTGK